MESDFLSVAFFRPDFCRCPPMSRVLVVDDSSTMRAVQSSCLKFLGIAAENISEATDGLHALVCLEQERFDLILCDLYMPRASGLEVLKEVRYTDSQTPFLMITTEAEESVIAEAMQLGANVYLVKPFPPSILQKKLERWLWPARATKPDYSCEAIEK